MDIAEHRQQMLASLDRNTLKAGLILSEAIDDDTNAVWFKDEKNMLMWVRSLGRGYHVKPEGMLAAMTNLIGHGYYTVTEGQRKGLILSRTMPGDKR